jgi:hypothetical protein
MGHLKISEIDGLILAVHFRGCKFIGYEISRIWQIRLKYAAGRRRSGQSMQGVSAGHAKMSGADQVKDVRKKGHPIHGLVIYTWPRKRGIILTGLTF